MAISKLQITNLLHLISQELEIITASQMSYIVGGQSILQPIAPIAQPPIQLFHPVAQIIAQPPIHIF